MNILNKLKGLFLKIDPLKESIEDSMANQLESLGKNKTVQDGEKALLKAGLKAGIAFIQSQGQNVSLTDEQYNQIIDTVMNTKSKLMPKLIAQLRKK